MKTKNLSQRFFKETSLLHISIRDFFRRINQYFFPTFLLTSIFSLFVIINPAEKDFIFLKAINEQSAIQTIRLLGSSAFLCIGFGILTSWLPLVSRPILWLGGSLAQITFDLLSIALGVTFGGILPLMLNWHGWPSLLFIAELILILFFTQCALVFGVVLSYTKFNQNNDGLLLNKLVRNEFTKQMLALLSLLIGFYIMYHTLYSQ